MDWHRATGGIGAPLECTTVLQVVDELPPRSRGEGDTEGDKGAAEGALVGVIWTKPDEHDGWHNGIPGSVEDVPAAILAMREEYKQLARLGEAEVPTIYLNEEYGPFKGYVGSRAADIKDLDPVKARYAVGTGLGLLYLREQFKQRAKKGQQVDEQVELDAQQAVARSVLSMMPAFDSLAREAGLDE